VAETLPGFDVDQWYGIAAPAKVPKAVVSALHAGFTEALKLPDVAQRLTADGSSIVGGTPDAFGERIRTDIAKWRKGGEGREHPDAVTVRHAIATVPIGTSR
jgi:tripartite-type tricarboxylate transporter receptor subunit TctC